MLTRLRQPSRVPSSISFGYLPTGSLWPDLTGRLFGQPNLLKRLQARDIMMALDIQATDTVLDFGCGAGYMTVEMAKLAHKAIGIDVLSYVGTIAVPSSLANRLAFTRANGADLPFPAAHFDRVLASEVLPMIPDPALFLAEIKRVLKPGGHLVVVNGTGRTEISEAYRSGSPQLRRLADRYPNRFPANYDEYCGRFQVVAGTARPGFQSEQEILDLLRDGGFRVVAIKHSPRRHAGEWLAWKQFELYLATGKLVQTRGFLIPYLLLSLLSFWDGEDYKSGLIVTATTDT
jgi:SAM-dependent methyltransferase